MIPFTKNLKWFILTNTKKTLRGLQTLFFCASMYRYYTNTNMKITEKFEIVSFITDQYLSESIRSIDNHFGEGYAKKNPELVSRMMGIMDNTSGRNGGNIAEYR